MTNPCAVLLLAAAVPCAAAPQGEPLVVKMATGVPHGSSWHQILRETADRWKALSAGVVVVRLFPAGVAGDDREVIRKMGQGALQAALLTPVGLAEIDKSVSALGVPMMYDSYDEVYFVLEGLRPRLEASLDAKGLVVLHWADGGWVRFFTQKPVAIPDDLKPLKLLSAAGDGTALDIWRSAGFNPVPVPPADVVAALQTGRLNALGCPPQFAVISQYYNHATNMTDLDWQMLLGATVIAKKTWESIPAQVRPALLQAAQEAGLRLRAEVRRGAARDVEAMKARGLKVVAVDGRARQLWRRTAESFYPRIRGSVVPAEAFDEAMRLRDQYRRQHPAGPRDH